MTSLKFLLSQGLDPTELFIEHTTYDQEFVYSVDFIDKGFVNEEKMKTDKFLVVAHKVYLENLNITPFKNEDFVTISFTHSSPEIAYKWLNSSILELNKYLARKTNLKASRSIEFFESAVIFCYLRRDKNFVIRLIKTRNKKIYVVY